MATDEGGIIYLEKDRLFYFDGTRILKLDFTPQVVRDSDVLNQDAMISLIFQFIDSNKLVPTGFLFVLSESVVFSTDSSETDQAKLDAEFRTFTDLVPFDLVMAKQYKMQMNTKSVAVNGELVNVIIDSFVNKGFTRDGVVPAFIFGNFGIRKGLDEDTARYFLTNHALAHGKSMVEGEVLPQTPKQPFKVEVRGKNKSLPYLIGGFVLLLIVLVIVIVMQK